MALNWENIDHWEAGEIALLALIAFLLALLCSMLMCIIYYGKIYHTLKQNEGKPLFSEGGDGPTYNATARPHSYRADTSDDDSQDMESQQNNINMANKDMRKSFGHSALIHNRSVNMMRYNTATMTTNQSGSTDSDSQSRSTTDDSQTETNTHTEHHNHNSNSNSNDNDEDDDIGMPINVQQRQLQQHAQMRYNYIVPHNPYMGYGNEMMQQQHHNKMVSHQPPPPPGAMHNMHNIYNKPGNAQHHNRQSNSNTVATMTSLSSITATEPRDRHSHKQHITDHLNVNNDAQYNSPSPKEQLILI